jgi:hypothetical protein
MMGSQPRSSPEANVAVALSTVFLVTLALLHLLEPEFDPSWRMISEYEIGSFGWLMRGAFVAWAGSLWALRATLRPHLQSRTGKVVRAWQALLSGALVGAGLFATNAITDPTPSVAHEVHRACGALVVLTFPFLASLTTRALRASGQPLGAVRWATALTWVGLLAFFASIIAARVNHPELGRVGPHVLMGWPNRAMVVLYHAWIIVAARRIR